MMTVFPEILNMSLTGSVVILLVLLARLGLKQAPKIYSYALWAVVLFRLLCPVALSAPVSVLELTPAAVVTESSEARIVGTSSLDYFVPRQNTEILPETAAQGGIAIPAAEASSVTLEWIVTAIWCLGVAVMVLCSVVVYLRLRRDLIGAVQYRENIYLADHIDSPFVLGVLRPRIYLPSSTPAWERKYIITHEQHHIRRLDHILKLLAYGALCLHWFNPLVWVAFLLGGKDMEMSCDEAVIQKLGSHIRADYSQSLLRLATHRRLISGTPLAFGEGNTRGRVLNMAHWKKPKLWVSILCLVLCSVILIACAVNPQQEAKSGKLEVQFNDLTLILPSGYDIQEEQEGIAFLSPEETVTGGICSYPVPDMYLITQDKDPSAWNAHDWLDALTLPESGDATLGYMGGGSVYGDYEVEYFRDLPEEEKEAVGDYVRLHTFFIGETQVYDVWFDRLVSDTQLETAVLKSVKVQKTHQVEEPTQPEMEEVYLERCRYAMQEFRGSKLGWGLQVQRLYNGEEDYHYSSHWCQGTSRVDIFSHPTGGKGAVYDSEGNLLTEDAMYQDSVYVQETPQARGAIYDSKGNLLVDKEMYHGTASTEELPTPGDLNWQAGAVPMDWAPWLTVMDWSDSNTTYIDTLVENGAITVMLRIDTAFYETTQDLGDSYFVNFLFNEEGGFLGIDLMVGLFQEGGFTQQERIVTDGKLIAEQIAQAKP